MQDNLKWKSGLDVIYLSACALHGVTPDNARLQDMDFDAVYEQSKAHRMQAITYMALNENAHVKPETKKLWLYDKELSLRRVLSFALEREKLIRFMENNGIKYMPMKGIILQNCYPKAGMRQMADNDILIDVERRREIRDFLKNSGYTVDGFDRPSPDTYHNDKGIEFELHPYLTTKSVNEKVYYYYLDVWERLIKDDNNKYGYHFTNEDFYIFQTFHAHKHLTYSGGVGIRTLTDIYVYIRKYGETLDWHYIHKVLDDLGMRRFEKLSRSMAQKAYDPRCIYLGAQEGLLDREEKELLDIFIASGAYGTARNAVAQGLMRASADKKTVGFGTKVKYCFRRLFPPMDYYTQNYPTLRKYKVLIPFFCIYRIIRIPFKSMKRIVSELKYIKNN